MNPSKRNSYEEFIAALEGHGSKVKNLRANEVMAQCPAHEDRNPSLHVTSGDGKVLLRCMAGCPTRSVLDALGLDEENLFDETGKTREQVEEYDYLDETGRLRFQVVRFYPKDFRQRRPMPGGQWAWNLHGVEPILYHLPELFAADDGAVVYLTEGEKDADRLMSLGVLATTAPMGAGKWRDHYAGFLIGKRVLIVADNDEQGLAHAERVKESLDAAGVTNKIKVAKEGKDVSDHLDRGHALEDLEDPSERAPILSTRRLPGAFEGEAEIVVGPLHVRARKPYRSWRGMASVIWPTVTVLGTQKRVHWGIEVQLVSASARAQLITALNRVEDIDKSKTSEWVEDLFVELVAWSEEREPLIQIASFPEIEESGPAFLMQPWWPATGSTVIAGTRASKKSYLALMLALSVTKGEAMIHTPKPGWAKVNKQARVAFLDWEAEIERIVPRVRALVPGGSLLYARERRPLAQSVDSIIDMIREEGIEAVVIDSLSASIGATLVDDEAANQFWDAVAALAVPVLVVAHKSADASSRRARKVFGSVMHEARPRVIWNVEVGTDNGFMVLECFKDSDYGLDGVRTAWDVEFTAQEFSPATRTYFNPIDPEQAVLDDDEEEQPVRRGESQTSVAQRRMAVLLALLQARKQLTGADAASELTQVFGVEIDPGKARGYLRKLAEKHPQIKTREVATTGRPAVIYFWED